MHCLRIITRHPELIFSVIPSEVEGSRSSNVHNVHKSKKIPIILKNVIKTLDKNGGGGGYDNVYNYSSVMNTMGQKQTA